MRKLLLILAVFSSLSFAESLNMQTLMCNGHRLVRGTTLLQMQNNCLVKEQWYGKGMYWMEFVNDSTGDVVTCRFATSRPSAHLNSCRG